MSTHEGSRNIPPLRVVKGGAARQRMGDGESRGNNAGQREAGNGLPDAAQQRRIVEALLFAAPEPLSEQQLAEALPASADVPALLAGLQAEYAERGVNLVRVAGKWQLRTAEDLRWLLRREAEKPKKLSRAALETLAIIAYHQPVTRAEIEDIRGVAISRGTLDVLMETGWVKVRGRRQQPGRPVTYGVTDAFLAHFGLDSIKDLPGLRELKGAGLLDADIPPDFRIPGGGDAQSLLDEEDPDDPFTPAEPEEEPPLEMHLENGDDAAGAKRLDNGGVADGSGQRE